MKRRFFFGAALAALMLAAVLTACGGGSFLPDGKLRSICHGVLQPGILLRTESSAGESEASSSETALSQEEAEALARERVPVDFENGYTLSAGEEALEEDGKQYYQFTVTGGDEDFTVLVDQQDGSVLTRHPDGNTYVVEEDPAFQLTPSQWGGIYATETGSVLTIELMDNNSFEFTLTAGDDILESETGRIVAGSTSQAEFTGADGLRLRFSHNGESIRVIAEDSAGGAYEGVYYPDK